MHTTESHIILDVTVISVLALIMELVALRFKVPPVIGLLLAGVIAGVFGPHGLELLGDGTETLLLLAEVGVGFLVLPVGIEFDLKKLISMWKEVILGGLIQLSLTTLIASFVYTNIFGGDFRTAILVGFLTTMSSTVVVVERLEERRKLHTTGGRLAVGILIFQDLSLLPLAFILPAMKPEAGASWIMPLLTGIIVLAVVFWLELKLVNPFLKMIIAKNDKALLTLALVAICLSLVVVCMFVNLSPVFGMFLAGLLFSRTESRCEVLGIALQAKKVFGPLHFVSFGLLIDYHLIGEHYLKIGISVIGLILIKLFTGWLSSVLMGCTLKSACKVSGALAHIGELSFILAAIGAKLGIITEIDFKVFVIIAVSTILISPFVMSFFLSLGDKFIDKSIIGWLLTYRPIRHGVFAITIFAYELFGEKVLRFIPTQAKEEFKKTSESTIVVIGYGIVGQYSTSSINARGIPVVVIESAYKESELARMNPGVCKVVFGESTNHQALLDAGIRNAKAVVMTFSGTTEREITLSEIRKIAPEVHVIIRVHRSEHIGELKQDEFTSIVIGEAAAAAATESQLCRALGLPNINPVEVGDLGKFILENSGNLLPIRQITGGAMSV